MTPTIARNIFIGLVSFLTLVDLFAAQALLPALAKAFAVSPAVMSSAVNASTLGMALAGLAVACFARRVDRQKAIGLSLLVLALPTLALSMTSDLTTFALLRVAQGTLMATAFTFTMTYLTESLSAQETAHALAAYVAGNVASNLFGRIMAAAAADHLGLGGAFVMFAALNVTGGILVRFGLQRLVAAKPLQEQATMSMGMPGNVFSPPLLACYGIGFLILFCFIGTFSYVNFVLVAPPLNLGQMSLGWVYLVFIPALVTTPFAGRFAAVLGQRRALLTGFALVSAGLILAAAPQLTVLLPGLALIGIGSFLAQAAMTAQVGRLAGANRIAASGLYLSSYYLGGLAGSIIVGLAFDRLGWTACVALMILAMVLAAKLAFNAAPVPSVSSAPVAVR
jgi:predicted MFS family arabinose efflux permease